MFFSLANLGALLLQYKYWVIFPAAFVEGPIITVIAGAGISLGILSWWPVYVLIVAGDLVSDAAHYYVGKWGGKPFIRRFGRFFRIRDEHVVSLEKVLNNHPGKAIILGKLSHGIGGAVLVAAGLVRMPFWKFMYWNVVGTLPKTLGLLIIGFYFAHAITKVNSIMDVIASVTIILSILIIFAWIYVYRKKAELP